MKMPIDLKIGEKVEVLYTTGEKELIIFDGLDSVQGLFPAVRYRSEWVQNRRVMRQIGWIRRSTIARLQRVEGERR
jgi:hypothetical protein